MLTGAAAHQRDTAGEVLKFMANGGPRRVQELVKGLGLTRPAADSAMKRLLDEQKLAKVGRGLYQLAQ